MGARIHPDKEKYSLTCCHASSVGGRGVVQVHGGRRLPNEGFLDDRVVPLGHNPHDDFEDDDASEAESDTESREGELAGALEEGATLSLPAETKGNGEAELGANEEGTNVEQMDELLILSFLQAVKTQVL
jgi:hypothetical protein